MLRNARRIFLAAVVGTSLAGLTAGITVAAETPQRGGTLTVGFKSDTKTLDPTFSIQWSERQVLYLIYNTLLRTGTGFVLHPELAKSWDIEAGGKRIVFHLQQGVKFHDGTDFDAAAVKWNIDRRLDEEIASPQRKQLRPVIDSVEVVDKYTVAFNLSKPFPPLLGQMAERAGFMMSPTAVKKYGKDYGSNPVGTGAFVLKEWVRGSHIIVERNENYWEKGVPYLDRVAFRDIAGAVIGIQRLTTGEVDFIDGLSPQNIRQVENNADVKLDPIPFGRWFALQWHWDEPPFNNSKLRKAIAYALDRDRINAIIMNGRAAISSGPTPEGLWWYDPGIERYDFNPERAKQLLKEAGIAPGTEIALSAPSNPVLTQMVQLIQEQLGAVGLKVKLEPAAQSEWYSRIVKREINFTPIRWTQRPDPDGLLYILFHSNGHANSTGYNNPEVDRLIEEARQSFDNELRKKLYSKIQRQIMDDLPFVPILFSSEFAAMNKKVRGFVWTPDQIPRFRTVWKAK